MKRAPVRPEVSKGTFERLSREAQPRASIPQSERRVSSRDRGRKRAINDRHEPSDVAFGAIGDKVSHETGSLAPGIERGKLEETRRHHRTESTADSGSNIDDMPAPYDARFTSTGSARQACGNSFFRLSTFGRSL